MAATSYDLTTYYAKRIIGDTAATTYDKALLYAGSAINSSMWIFGHNRANYGIKYVYQTTNNLAEDQIEIHGGHATNTTARIKLRTGDIFVNNVTAADGSFTKLTTSTSGSVLTGTVTITGTVASIPLIVRGIYGCNDNGVRGSTTNGVTTYTDENCGLYLNYTGGTIHLGGADSAVDSGTTSLNYVDIAYTQAATSLSNGALRVAGGISLQKSIYAGNNIYAGQNAVTGTAYYVGVTAADVSTNKNTSATVSGTIYLVANGSTGNRAILLTNIGQNANDFIAPLICDRDQNIILKVYNGTVRKEMKIRADTNTSYTGITFDHRFWTIPMSGGDRYFVGTDSYPYVVGKLAVATGVDSINADGTISLGYFDKEAERDPSAAGSRGHAVGLFVKGTCYGNNAAHLASSNINVFSYGDPGPQIRFSTTFGTDYAGATDESAAIIWSGHSTNIGLDSAFHFVAKKNSSNDEANLGIVVPTIVAKQRIFIGKPYAVSNVSNDTSLALYVNGMIFIQADYGRSADVSSNSYRTIYFKDNSENPVNLGFLRVSKSTNQIQGIQLGVYYNYADNSTAALFGLYRIITARDSDQQVTESHSYISWEGRIKNTVLPETTATYDIGSTDLYWQNAYFSGTIKTNYITSDNNISMYSASGKTLAVDSKSTLYFSSGSSNSIIFYRGGIDAANETARFNTTGAFIPKTTNTGSIGTTSVKWGNIYAKDLHGELDGNASTATKWAAAQKVYVTLGTASTTTTIQGGSTSAETIGVNGQLKVANGGTGVATLASGEALIGNGTSAVTTRGIRNNTSKSHLGWTAASTDITLVTTNTIAYWNGQYKSGSSNLTYCVKGEFGDAAIKGVKDQSSNGALTSSGTDLLTERAVYYGLTVINNASQSRANSIYAPTGAGTAGNVLVAKGSTTAPAWYGGLSLTGAGTTASPYAASFSNTVQTGGNVGINVAPDTTYALKVTGKSYLDSTTASSTGTTSGQLLVSNSNGGAVALELWRNTNGSWQLAVESADLIFRSNYYKGTSDSNAKTQTTYGLQSLTLYDSTGNGAIPGLAVGQTTQNTSYTLYVNGTSKLNGNTEVGGHLQPATTASYNIGALATAWNNIVGNSFYVGANGVRYGRFWPSVEGTTTTNGQTILAVGNETATGTANNARGRLRLYSINTFYQEIVADEPGGTTPDDRTWYLPSVPGNRSFVGTLTTGFPYTQYGVLYAGSNTYVTYTAAGAAGTVLIGGGTSAAPSWYDGLTLTGAGTSASPYVATFSNKCSIPLLEIPARGGTYGTTGSTTIWYNGESGVTATGETANRVRCDKIFVALGVQAFNGNFWAFHTDVDVTKSNNNVTTDVARYLYFGDKNANWFARLSGYANASGSVTSYWQVRSFNGTTANTQRGMAITMDKAGTISYSVYNRSAFRTAIDTVEIQTLANTSGQIFYMQYNTEAITHSTTSAYSQHEMRMIFRTNGLALYDNTSSTTVWSTTNLLPKSAGTGQMLTGALCFRTAATKGTAVSSNATGYISFYEAGTGTAGSNRIAMIYAYQESGQVDNRIRMYAYKGASGTTTNAYFGTWYITSSDTKRTETNCKVYGAIWNDYAEYRRTLKDAKPGQVVIDNDDGTLSLTTKRLQAGAQVITDTFGFAIGETEETKTPLAVSGRVLVNTYRDRYEYHAGQSVCSAPNGTVDIMSRDEIMMYPDAIVGIVSEIPEYEVWGQDNVPVNGRIWIRVR